MRKFSEEEIKVIQQLVLEAQEGESMDIEEFFKEVEQEERSRAKLGKTTKLKLKNMLNRITSRFVKI